MLTILLLCITLCFRNACSSIHTAVFKNQNPGIPHSISLRQMLQCCAASLEANYMGISVNKQTGECFKILNDGSLPVNSGDFKTTMKTRNTFTLIPQMSLYKNSDSDRVAYLSEIPGGVVVTGLIIDVILQPVDPWIQIIIALTDATLGNRPLHFALRKDLQLVRFNHKQNGNFGSVDNCVPPGGFIYENNDIYKFTIVVADTHYEMKSNDTTLHQFAHRLNMNIATHLYSYAIGGSHATLYKNPDSDRSTYLTYLAEIPGGDVVTGLVIDVILQPIDPWTQIIIALTGATLGNRPLHFALRNDLKKFNHKLNNIFGCPRQTQHLRFETFLRPEDHTDWEIAPPSYDPQSWGSLVFKNRNPDIPHSISTRQMLRCCAASLEANYMGVSVDKQTGDCFKILNDGSLTMSLEDYKMIMKTRNTFTLIPQMSLYRHSDSDKSAYLSEILGGGVVTGMVIDVILQPIDPWTQIIIALTDATLGNRPLNFKLRNDLKLVKFNHKLNDNFGTADIYAPPGGFIYENNDIYKLTIIVTDTHYEIKSNDTILHLFAHRLDMNIATHLYCFVHSGSHATLYKVAFHLPAT